MINKVKRGFTIIELIVVIAIIAVLAAIIIAGVNDANRKARNAKRLMDIKNYAVAFNMAIAKNGEYPDPGDTTLYCLGDYGVKGSTDPGDTCFGGLYHESSVLNGIVAEFVKLPAGEDPIIIDGTNKGAYSYRCFRDQNGICYQAQVNWFMKGKNQSCGVGTVLSSDSGGNTQCRYQVSF